MQEEDFESIQQQILVTHRSDGTWFDKQDDDFVMMTWNINRLMNKVDDLQNYVMSFDGLIHVIVIIETFLTSENAHLCNL